MKTPDEIKKGLECCHITACGNCPYMTEEIECREIFSDALAYIQQIERERDVAVEELKQSLSCCKYCKHDRPFNGCAAEPKLDRSCFEWHGVKEEKTNED